MDGGHDTGDANLLVENFFCLITCARDSFPSATVDLETRGFQ